MEPAADRRIAAPNARKNSCVFLGFGKSRMKCSLNFSLQRIAPESHPGQAAPLRTAWTENQAETVQKKVDMCIMTAARRSKIEIPVYIKNHEH
jgi:hypothetical protein